MTSFKIDLQGDDSGTSTLEQVLSPTEIFEKRPQFKGLMFSIPVKEVGSLVFWGTKFVAPEVEKLGTSAGILVYVCGIIFVLLMARNLWRKNRNIEVHSSVGFNYKNTKSLKGIEDVPNPFAALKDVSRLAKYGLKTTGKTATNMKLCSAENLKSELRFLGVIKQFDSDF